MRDALKNQMLAALATLGQCAENCPDSEWGESRGDAPFSQALFHALFYADFYMSDGAGDFRSQPFHAERVGMFRDYEELEDREPRETYSRAEITAYLDFCRAKAAAYFAEVSDDGLLAQSGHRGMSRAEIAIYSTRHVQHHAAQLGLRLQQAGGKALRWESSGWERPSRA